MNSTIPFLQSVALIGNLCASVFLTCITLVIQCVQYPLLSNISAFDFSCYYKKFLDRISWILFPTMISELLVATWLCFLPMPSHWQLPLLGSFLLLGISAMTTLIIIAPLNQKMQDAYDQKLLRKIGLFNRIRLGSWALRSLLLGWVLLYLK